VPESRLVKVAMQQLSLIDETLSQFQHSHDFLGLSLEAFERRTWAGIVNPCVALMLPRRCPGNACDQERSHMGAHVAAISGEPKKEPPIISSNIEQTQSVDDR
jgi:hypothetical protein